jgi:hypothetical protein
MSSIGPNVPPTGPVKLPSVAPAAQTGAATPTATAPTYLQSFSGASTAIALGLSTPRNLGDTEALFAEISTKLEATRTTNEDNDAIAKSAARRTEMARLSSLITLLTNFSAIRDIEIEAEVPIANRAAAEAARDSAQADVDTYTNSISNLDNPNVSRLPTSSVSGRALRGSIPYETAQRNQAAGQLSGLVNPPQGNWPSGSSYQAGLTYFLGNAQNGASAADITSAYNAWYSGNVYLSNAQAERGELVSLRATAQSTVDAQQAEYERWDAIAAPLEAEINQAKDNLPAATTTEANTGNSFSFADLMTFFAALLPTVSGTMLNMQQDKARESGVTNEIVSDVDQNLEDIIDQIRDIDYERLELQFMSRMSAGDPGSGVTGDATGSAFGGLSRAEALAMAFGGVILGSIEGLGLVAGQGGGGFGSAGALAEAGAMRTRVAI